METAKATIICHSYHHMNTLKIAEVFAKVLGARVTSPLECDPDAIRSSELVGFGAGIDSGRHYKPLLDFVDRLPTADNKKAFIFSTAGLTWKTKMVEDHKALREKLQSKGYAIVDEFQCRGFNTNSFLKYFGGINRGRPNQDDQKRAQDMAKRLL